MPFFSEAGEHLQAAGQARGSSDADRLVMAGLGPSSSLNIT
jgi:hypothetical protein